MHRPAELDPVISDPGNGTGGVEDVGGLVTCRPLENIDGVWHEDLSDDEEQGTDSDVAAQVKGRLVVMLDKSGGGDRNSEQQQGVGDDRQAVRKLEIMLKTWNGDRQLFPWRPD